MELHQDLLVHVAVALYHHRGHPGHSNRRWRDRIQLRRRDSKEEREAGATEFACKAKVRQFPKF